MCVCVCVFMNLQKPVKVLINAVYTKGREACSAHFTYGVSVCVYSGRRHVTCQYTYTYYFLIFILAKLVFKLELSKCVYCTLEVYTGADIQPKVFVQILLRYFHKHFL